MLLLRNILWRWELLSAVEWPGASGGWHCLFLHFDVKKKNWSSDWDKPSKIYYKRIESGWHWFFGISDELKFYLVLVFDMKKDLDDYSPPTKRKDERLCQRRGLTSGLWRGWHCFDNYFPEKENRCTFMMKRSFFKLLLMSSKREVDRLCASLKKKQRKPKRSWSSYCNHSCRR